MKKLILSNSPLFALVDDDVHPKVNGENWFLGSHGYVVNNAGTKLLHRQIMGEPDCLVDHEDRDKLNNQRHNLRLATRALNMANSGPHAGRKFKGVTSRKAGRYIARICINGKLIHLGTFDTDIEAARAYNKAALVAWGEFAYLNSVDQ